MFGLKNLYENYGNYELPHILKNDATKSDKNQFETYHHELQAVEQQI